MDPRGPVGLHQPDGLPDLPLADFGSAGFGLARTQSSRGHTGTISDAAWDATRIELTPSGRRYVGAGGSGSSAGTATPSSLSAGGSAFSLTFASVAVAAKSFFAARQPVPQTAYRMHGR